MIGRFVSDNNKVEWWVVKFDDLYFKEVRVLKEE